MQCLYVKAQIKYSGSYDAVRGLILCNGDLKICDMDALLDADA